MLLENQFERSEVVHFDRTGKQTLLSWTDWSNTLASFSRDRRILFSVASPLPTLTGLQPALVVMRGWTDRQRRSWAGQLARLFRIDLTRGQVLEERSLGPVDPTGWLGTAHVAVSPDGQELALMFGRTLGHLYVLRDLPTAPR